MKAFFWFCLALLIPGLLLRIPIGGAGILATDIIVPLFAVVWIFEKLVVTRKFPRARFLIPGFIFLLIASLSFLWGSYDLDLTAKIVSGAYLLRFFSFLIFGWAASDLFRDTKDKFFHTLFIITSVVVILGFLQFFLIPDISTWSKEGGLDPHMGRLLGTWLDPNFVAGFLGLMTPIILGKWYDHPFRTEKFWLSLLLAGILAALFLTFSRSGYLAAVLGLGIFFVFRDPKVILVGILFASLGIASSERAQKRLTELSGTVSAIVMQDTDEIDPTANLRILSWRKSFGLWEKYPFTGIGYNTYRYRASEEGIVDENYFSSGGSDSTHLTVLVTTGIFGFFAFLWFYFSLFWNNFRKSWKQKSSLHLGFAAGMGALFLHGIFVNSILFPFLFLPLIATAGVLCHNDA